MIQRTAFFLIVIFWITMNVLLWRAEYGSYRGGFPVPVGLVCRKILTAPDASSLSVYQEKERMGYCEFSTSVEQEMSQLDADQPPPEGIVPQSSYQVRVNGNVAIGDFTNRVQFDAEITFSRQREWRELNLKFNSHFASLRIHALATNQTATIVYTQYGFPPISRDFTFAQLQNPNILLHAFDEDSSDDFMDSFNLPMLPQIPGALVQTFDWKACRDRLLVGHEAVSVYRLETSVLGNPVDIYVSTLGEILRVELPGNITAAVDGWSK
jgi:hypothetical protein